MGSGFSCTIINLSSGAVAFAPPVTTSNGRLTLPPGQSALLRALTYSGGDVVFVDMEGGVSVLGAPGQVTGPAVTVTGSDSVVLSWRTPSAGDAVSSYLVNYRQTSLGGDWTFLSASGNCLTVTGLLAATGYDFQVSAVNATGSGPASCIVSATTAA